MNKSALYSLLSVSHRSAVFGGSCVPANTPPTAADLVFAPVFSISLRSFSRREVFVAYIRRNVGRFCIYLFE